MPDPQPISDNCSVWALNRAAVKGCCATLSEQGSQGSSRAYYVEQQIF